MRSQRHALSSDGESMCLSVHDPGLTQACRAGLYHTTCAAQPLADVLLHRSFRPMALRNVLQSSLIEAPD